MIIIIIRLCRFVQKQTHASLGKVWLQISLQCILLQVWPSPAFGSLRSSLKSTFLSTYPRYFGTLSSSLKSTFFPLTQDIGEVLNLIRPGMTQAWKRSKHRSTFPVLPNNVGHMEIDWIYQIIFFFYYSVSVVFTDQMLPLLKDNFTQIKTLKKWRCLMVMIITIMGVLRALLMWLLCCVNPINSLTTTRADSHRNVLAFGIICH